MKYQGPSSAATYTISSCGAGNSYLTAITAEGGQWDPPLQLEIIGEWELQELADIILIAAGRMDTRWVAPDAGRHP